MSLSQGLTVIYKERDMNFDAITNRHWSSQFGGQCNGCFASSATTSLFNRAAPYRRKYHGEVDDLEPHVPSRRQQSVDRPLIDRYSGPEM